LLVAGNPLVDATTSAGGRKRRATLAIRARDSQRDDSDVAMAKEVFRKSSSKCWWTASAQRKPGMTRPITRVRNSVFGCVALFAVLTLAYAQGKPPAIPNDSDQAPRLGRETTLTLYHEDSLALPKKEDVQEMTAELYSHPYGYPDVPTFRVPAADIEEILAFLDQPEPPKGIYLSDREIGCIRIACRNGEVKHVISFFRGQASTSYSIQGIRCSCKVDSRPDLPQERATGGNIALDLRLRRIFERVTGHVVTKLPAAPDAAEADDVDDHG
jgi:hypothetical protein